MDLVFECTTLRIQLVYKQPITDLIASCESGVEHMRHLDFFMFHFLIEKAEQPSTLLPYQEQEKGVPKRERKRNALSSEP